MKCIFLFLCLFPAALYSQSIRIREIKSKPIPKYYNTADSTIVYPIIVSANQAVNRLVNDAIKKEVLDPANDKTTAWEAIRGMMQTGLTDLGYEVTCNRNGILSLKIGIQVEAAYPNNWDIYLNFDIRTGRRLGIRDIINDSMFEAFKSRVFADKIDSLTNYKENGLKSRLFDKEIDTATYRWAMETVDSFCINSIKLDNFSISAKGIEIIDDCVFAHIIRAIEPDYALSYSWQFMRRYLGVKFQERLPNR